MVAASQTSRATSSVAALIASPRVAIYLVGITSTPGARRSAYKREGFDLYFTLEQELYLADALSLEKAVFDALLASKKAATHRKYHPDKRGSKYRASSGGKAVEGKVYSLYVAARTSPKGEA